MKHRKLFAALLAATVAGSLAACASSTPATTPAPTAPAASTNAAATAGYTAPFTVSKPVVINIVDVAGNAQLSQGAIDAFKAQHSEIVSDITISKLTAPELAGKIKAQQDANNIDTTMILTGMDGLSACLDQNLLQQLMPTYSTQFQPIIDQYLDGAKGAYDLGNGYGIVTVFCPGGPMLTYNPDAVTTPIKTPQDLLDWCKAHPNKFLYARPANSGPGRAFVMGLPYLLGDTDPKDPATWDKTWAYLKELDQYIEYYPTGTAAVFKELGDGTRDMVASHIGWDMNQRILGTIPANYQGSFFDGQTFINDAHYACIPNGLSDDQKNAVLDLIVWLMQPDMQAITYDTGYFYPGPAIKGITIDMAPADSKAQVSAAMRPEYDQAIASYANTTSLSPEAMVTMYDMWDKLVGAKTQQ